MCDSVTERFFRAPGLRTKYFKRLFLSYNKLYICILELMKSKKKVFGGFNDSLLRNILGGAIAFLISLKGHFKKVWKTLDYIYKS